MLLVVFGAGASFDSCPYLPPEHSSEFARPPLADQIFASRFLRVISDTKYREHLPPVVTRMLDGSVEGKLEELRAEAKGNSEVPKQLAAVQYYLQELIQNCQSMWNQRIEQRGRVTNYRSFIDEVEGWRERLGIDEVFFVTFNYDTLLEEALGADPRTRMRVAEMDDYVMGRYKVIKPHGSINWSHRVTFCPFDCEHKNEGDLIPLLIENVSALRIEPEVDLLEINRVVTPQPKYPALAIPVREKSDFECPSNHLQKLWEFLPKAKILITIGWRATEKKFMERLVRGLPSDVRVQIVSSSQESAEETKLHMLEQGLVREIFVSPAQGFTQYAKNVDAKRFLNQMVER